jgi:hypothetical protein
MKPPKPDLGFESSVPLVEEESVDCVWDTTVDAESRKTEKTNKWIVRETLVRANLEI